MGTTLRTDVLVIGGGGTAVRSALEAARRGVSVTLVDKGRLACSGTSPLGLHGMVSTLNPDTDSETLVGDILREGQNVNDVDLVRAAVEASSAEVSSLTDLGVKFAKTPDGSYHFYRGTGHSANYGLTFSEELSGVNFVVILAKEAWKLGVRLVENTMIVDLVVVGDRVVGAIALDLDGNLQVIEAGAVILAAGGANRLYPNTVPRISDPMYATTGDAYALALRAGLPLVDMEFANFRETPPAARIGRYMNAKGEAFMTTYDPRGEAASRGKIVEALYTEMQRGNGPIWIDLNADAQQAAKILPQEYRDYVAARLEGREPKVTITFQRLLGGTRIRADTSTSIQGLYAAGEATGGLHGADRLQGMAFLETQVFGALAGATAADFVKTSNSAKDSGLALANGLERASTRLVGRTLGDADAMKKEIQGLAWNCAGIVRNQPDLEAGLQGIREIRKRAEKQMGANVFEGIEVENLALTAEAVIASSLMRNESRGTHRRSDFPAMSPEWFRKHVVARLAEGDHIEVSSTPSRD